MTTKDRYNLVQAIIRPGRSSSSSGKKTPVMRKLQRTMNELGVDDITFRMFQNHELSAAMGFDADYVFFGKKHEVTRQIGNSVSVEMAAALVEAAA